MQFKAVLALALATTASAAAAAAAEASTGIPLPPSVVVSYLKPYVTEPAERSSMTADPTGWVSNLESEVEHNQTPSWASGLPNSIKAQMGLETAKPTSAGGSGGKTTTKPGKTTKPATSTTTKKGSTDTKGVLPIPAQVVPQGLGTVLGDSSGYSATSGGGGGVDIIGSLSGEQGKLTGGTGA